MKTVKKQFCALFFAALIAGASLPAAAIPAFAESASGTHTNGEIVNGSWIYEDETGTLTLTGERLVILDTADAPWKEYEGKIKELILPYNMRVSENNAGTVSRYLYHLAERIVSTHPDGFRWTFVPSENALTLSGKGEWPKMNDWEWSSWTFLDNVQQLGTLRVDDGITHIQHSTLTAENVSLGKDVQLSNFIWDNYVLKSFAVSSENPYYAVYDHCLYAKDFTTLYSVPRDEKPDFHPALETIGSYALQTNKGLQLVLPWGVTTLEDSAISFQESVVLPDTVTKIGDYNYGRFTYSDGNTAVKAYLARFSNAEHSVPVTRVVSVASYYGIKAGEWYAAGGNHYYFDANGVMASGKTTIDGVEYEFDASGKLVKGNPPESTGDSSGSGSGGAAGEGWVSSLGKNYYYQDGKLLTGLQTIDGQIYYFGEDGARADSQWVSSGGVWYYLNAYGAALRESWRELDGKHYYFGADSRMLAGVWHEENGVWYYLGNDGARYENRWVKLRNVWYRFDEQGRMAASCWRMIDSKWYYFYSSGAMAVSQWVRSDGVWYYLTGSGEMAKNRWVETEGSWYYLGSDGAMLINAETPDGYRVDGLGRWIL